MRLATAFSEALERLSIEIYAPMYFRSACRAPNHNIQVPGQARSLHLTVNEHHGAGEDPADRGFVIIIVTILSFISRPHSP